MDIGLFIKTATERRFIRFVVAGTANTLWGLAVYAGCVVAGLPAWAAMLVSVLVSIAFNFLSFGGYAFRDLSARRLPRFISGYAALYALNLAAFQLVHTRIASLLACQAVLVVPMSLVSYLVMSKLVFAGKPRAPRQ